MDEIGSGELAWVRDSKLLSEQRREMLFEVLAPFCLAWSIGHAEHYECDELGMSSAQRLAAARALEGVVACLGRSPNLLLLDGKWDFIGSTDSVAVVKGDQRSFAIATASILAKVSRDRIMRAEHQHYPVYDFEHNKGYPSLQHRIALAGWGASPIHRRSWSFMNKLIW
jgi:ribonuclease HII